MAYIPLNKIVTNLYTPGEEYQLVDGGEYEGFYYKLYTGEILTGKTPNDLPNPRKLIPMIQVQEQGNPKKVISPSFLNDDGPPFPIGMNSDNTDTSMNQPYMYLTRGKVEEVILNQPSTYFPTPTQDDYNIGSFPRYFCFKINENIYIEINKDTYKALAGKFKDWNHQFYTPFKITWTLIGKEKEVEQVNYNITLLQERRNKRGGFQLFLKYNYTKFFKPNSKSTDDFQTPPNTNTQNTSNNSSGGIGGY